MSFFHESFIEIYGIGEIQSVQFLLLNAKKTTKRKTGSLKNNPYKHIIELSIHCTVAILRTIILDAYVIVYAIKKYTEHKN